MGSERRAVMATGTERAAHPAGRAPVRAGHPLLGLQRQLGNAAVVRLLRTSAAPTTTVRRYHKVGPDGIGPGPGQWQGLGNGTWRISDDEKMAVRDSNMKKVVGGADLQAFYADPDVLREAAGKLGAIGSPYVLSQGAGRARGPEGKDGRPTLAQVLFEHADRRNPDVDVDDEDVDTGPLRTTFRVCDENTRNALGMHRPGQNAGRSVGAVSSALGEQPMNLLDEQSKFLANQAVNQIIEAVAKADARTERKRGVVPWTRRISVPKSDETLRQWAMKHYRSLPPQVRKVLSQEFDIDEFAVPAVGEAIGVVDPASKVGHFIPAVAASGGDWVSLENDTDQRGQDVNSDTWYYRMYGTAEQHQTAFDEAADAGVYGSVPLVFRLAPIETLQTVGDCDALARRTYTNGVALLATSQHSFGSFYLQDVEGSRELLARVKERVETAPTDLDDVPAELAVWKKEAEAILGRCATPARQKLAERGLRLIERVGQELDAIGRRRDALDTAT